MDETGRRPDRITYVVGAEKRLRDIFSEAEAMPLLQGVVRAGAIRAALADAEGEVLWCCGDSASGGQEVQIKLPLVLEGEIIGTASVEGPKDQEGRLQALAGLFADTINTLLFNNLKRMLTTEIHTSVVNQSYEELLKANRGLAISEARYRDLAQNLAKIVEQRTRELELIHTKLLQKEKLAAVGQLAAGVAHEINNPLGFILSNLNTLNKYVARFREMLTLYRSEVTGSLINEEVRLAFGQRWKRLKLDACLEDAPALLRESAEGCTRVQKIVSSLKDFSHVDDIKTNAIDLNHEIDRTLNVLAHHIPTDAKITKRYGELPAIAGNPAMLCQAFYSIMLNALQAKPSALEMVITTRQEDGRIIIRFADNGPGIAGEIKGRVFEPFFTTKEVGQGMGMGLATAYETVTSLGGTIDVESAPGLGATFVITLPVERT